MERGWHPRSNCWCLLQVSVLTNGSVEGVAKPVLAAGGALQLLKGPLLDINMAQVAWVLCLCGSCVCVGLWVLGCSVLLTQHPAPAAASAVAHVDTPLLRAHTHTRRRGSRLRRRTDLRQQG
jgi:hypothetical protein